MNVRIARTDEEIAACFPVMRELRACTAEASFVERIRDQEGDGYRLVYLIRDEKPVSVAGIRFGRNLARGRFLYIDDLVTLSSARSRGFGAALLHWLIEYAREHGCDEVHLDSGIHRKDAHRFYEREGMELSSHHFRVSLQSEEA